MNKTELFDKVYGCLLGGLIGDAFGAPVEGMHYKDIAEKYGKVTTFSGAGTDDSAIKLIICRALLKHGGYITMDELAESFLAHEEFYELFFVPVRNMYYKIKNDITLPVDAGFGNMHSSSSAMAISPMGIVNAANPRQAAIEAYEIAGLVHSGPAAFCRDGATAIAAATAEAMRAQTSIDAIINAATAYLHKKSAKVMTERINAAVALAKEVKSYEKFREIYYETSLEYLICDSRETIPATLALFYLAKGDVETTIIYSANFGRDTDTIASMAGAIAGAYNGIAGFPDAWVQHIEKENSTQRQLAADMTEITVKRINEWKEYCSNFN